MKLQRLIPVAVAAVLLAGFAVAAGHPDISGTWAIDAAKSDFGPNPVPDDLTLKIKVEGDDFFVNQSGGGQSTLDLHFNTAGKEMANDVPGAKMTSTHHWDGNDIVGEIKIATDDGADITFKDRISYSADGKVMTLNRAVTGPMGDGQMKIVMNKK